MGVDVVAAGGQDAPYPHVYIDDVAAGRRAVDHLIMLGHRRIAMIEATDPDQPVQLVDVPRRTSQLSPTLRSRLTIGSLRASVGARSTELMR